MKLKRSARQRRNSRLASPQPGQPAQGVVPASSAATKPRQVKAKRQPRRPFRLSGGWIVAGVALVILMGILALVWSGQTNQAGKAGKEQFQVGSPGPGAAAPPIKLMATDGSAFDLSTYKDKTVLLYFQEGVGCQPCWTQLKEIDGSISDFKAQGIDQVVTITGDPVDALKQKASLEGINTPVLSDPGLSVSRTYSANQYGMMGASADGHTFIVVGPDGVVKWRADYGGAPNYTMYVPVPNLLADMKAGTKRG